MLLQVVLGTRKEIAILARSLRSHMAAVAQQALRKRKEIRGDIRRSAGEQRSEFNELRRSANVVSMGLWNQLENIAAKASKLEMSVYKTQNRGGALMDALLFEMEPLDQNLRDALKKQYDAVQAAKSAMMKSVKERNRELIADIGGELDEAQKNAERAATTLAQEGSSILLKSADEMRILLDRVDDQIESLEQKSRRALALAAIFQVHRCRNDF